MEITKEELENLARLEKRAYSKRWREANRDKVKATNQRYWERKAIKVAESNVVEDMESIMVIE